ncbi:Junctophilin-3 [Folsomia candida]|uniref:Junctophilin-3 n=1 Tax=Folsomia candida TaxID=158441 RepID=A0A226F3A3_FOLCA|nr:Junctophilin-3 [Folsomia candida]
MDRAKKSRKPVRQQVTKLCNEIEAEIATGVPYRQTLLDLLKKLDVASTKLINEDDKVKEAMLDDDVADVDLETEADDCEKYQDKILVAERIARNAITPELVSSFPQTAENYGQALDALKQTYGRESLLMQVYIRELLKLVICNVSQKEKIPLDVMYLKLESHLRALKTLNLAAADPATWLFPLVESSLSVETLQAWQRSPLSKVDGKLENPPRSCLDLMMEFIKNEVQGQQQIALAQTGFQSSSSGKDGKNKRHRKSEDEEYPVTAAALVAGDVKKIRCVFCGKNNHQSQDCFRAKKMSHEDKLAKVKGANVCFRCLRPGHIFRKCKVRVDCPTCEKGHYQVMVQEKKDGDSDGVHEVTEGVKTMVVSQPSALAMGVSSKQDKIVLRGTMQVKVLGPNNEVRNVRVLVDSGSDISYIQRKLADDLKLKPVGKRMFQTEVFGGGHEIAERKEYSVKIQGINGGKENLQTFSQEYICGVCDPVPYGPWVNELMKMKVYLTDVASDPSEIHILLGSNHIGRILTGRMAKVSPTIIATETTVGWYLNGEASVLKQRTMAQLCIAKLAKTEDISVLWDLDILGIKDSALRVSTEEHDQQVKEDFQKKLRRADDGRYIVKLPWIRTFQGQWLRGLRHGYGVRTSAPFGMASHFRPKAPKEGSMTSLKSESAAEPTSERDRRMDDVRGGFVLKARSDEPPARRRSLSERSSNFKDSILKGLKLRKQRSTGDLVDKRGTNSSIRSTGSSTKV